MNLTQAGFQSYVGDPIPSSAATQAQQVPFPWIAWNARPYASPIELFNVPFSAPERLLFEFNSFTTPVSYATATSTTGLTLAKAFNPYGPTSPAAPSALINSRSPFGHLLNFLETADKNFTANQRL